MKKIIVALLFFIPVLSHAQVIFTEIMYDPEGADTGREWIEVHNLGTQAIDLTAWKLFEANTNHKIIEYKGGKMLNPESFAVIADNPEKFLIDFPDYTGIIFDSAFSLSNTGETLILRNEGLEDVDIVEYSSQYGANGDGKSLQKIRNEWRAFMPNPGLGSMISNNDSSESSTTHDTTTTTSSSVTTNTSASTKTLSAHANAVPLSSQKEIGHLEVLMGRNRLASVGSVIYFEANVKQKDNALQYTWSLGDGTKKEGQKILHSYSHSGEYNVVLNVTDGTVSGVGRISVLVYDARLQVTQIPDALSIVNNSDYEINIGNWILEDGSSRFVFAPDTIIGKGKHLKISNSITGLKHDVSLRSVEGTIVTQSLNMHSVHEETLAMLYTRLEVAQKELTTLKGISESEAPHEEYVESHNETDIHLAQVNSALPKHSAKIDKSQSFFSRIKKLFGF